MTLEEMIESLVAKDILPEIKAFRGDEGVFWLVSATGLKYQYCRTKLKDALRMAVKEINENQRRNN